jgi:hypothetical protein
MRVLANQIETQLNQNVDPAMVAPLLSRFRNGMAHLCLGTEELAGYAADPFAFLNDPAAYTSYGQVDELRDAGLLNDCEVPLALLYWTRSGLQFVDLWSVRRPVTPPSPAGQWSPLMDSRRIAESLSSFLQFQAQLEELRSGGLSQAVLSGVRVVDYFRFLPAAGIIPIARSGGVLGFDSIRFFDGHTTRTDPKQDAVFIEGALLEPLFRKSLCYPPIDLEDAQMVWLYRVRENKQVVEVNQTNPPPDYLIFVNGHTPDRGAARYDLNRWDYSNYA